MIKHVHTESTTLNFAKLEERITKINDPVLGKYESIKRMLNELTIFKRPTLILATGGSKVIAYYLQLIMEKMGLICEVIEPRDYFYKANIDSFSNLVAISASGKTNGIEDALSNFKGNRYLVCENEKNAEYNVISWGNELYDKEKSFISLASSLGLMLLFLESAISLHKEINLEDIKKINNKIKELLFRSEEKISKMDVCFKDISLIQIMSGYETRTSCCTLESNLAEVGLVAPVVHDKGSFCHGRSNLLFQYPDSYVIYLTHRLKDLDKLLIENISREYSNLLLFNTDDLDENLFWKEYYLTLQMYFLSKKIASDKNIDLTMPEYNPKLVKKIYNFRGEM